MTDRAILLSLAPEFATMIASGTKTVELRKRFPRVPPGTWVFFYVTLPVGAVLGRARVAEIELDFPEKLWHRHHQSVGISSARFDSYFRDTKIGAAIRLTEYQPLEAVNLRKLRHSFDGFVAPQSFRFLDTSMQSILLGHAREH